MTKAEYHSESPIQWVSETIGLCSGGRSINI